jgi:hypothetical protein
MDITKIKTYLHLLRSIAQLLSLARLYPNTHPMVQTKSAEVFSEIQTISLKKDSLVFAVQGNVMFLNGEQLEAQDPLIKRLIDDFAKLKLGSLDLEPGLTLEEMSIFITLLNDPGKIIGEEQAKKFLEENKAKNIIPRFATYKLVQENEKVVKEDTVVNIDNMSSEAVKAFSADLKNNIIQNKDLVHNAGFLSVALTDLSKEISTPEGLSKIIWVIGEYLIEEISTAKQEEVNRKVLEQLKGQLLSSWEKKENKAEWKEKTEESFVKIISALQLKRLFVLYKKHKKGIEGVSRKMKSMLKNIPEESQLYQKVKEDLQKMGIPKLDAELFF